MILHERRIFFEEHKEDRRRIVCGFRFLVAGQAL
jgi:hypothetical protein